jgi:hypothetical protein
MHIVRRFIHLCNDHWIEMHAVPQHSSTSGLASTVGCGRLVLLVDLQLKEPTPPAHLHHPQSIDPPYSASCICCHLNLALVTINPNKHEPIALDIAAVFQVWCDGYQALMIAACWIESPFSIYRNRYLSPCRLCSMLYALAMLLCSVRWLLYDSVRTCCARPIDSCMQSVACHHCCGT